MYKAVVILAIVSILVASPAQALPKVCHRAYGIILNTLESLGFRQNPAKTAVVQIIAELHQEVRGLELTEAQQREADRLGEIYVAEMMERAVAESSLPGLRTKRQEISNMIDWGIARRVGKETEAQEALDALDLRIREYQALLASPVKATPPSQTPGIKMGDEALRNRVIARFWKEYDARSSNLTPEQQIEVLGYFISHGVRPATLSGQVVFSSSTKVLGQVLANHNESMETFGRIAIEAVNRLIAMKTVEAWKMIGAAFVVPGHPLGMKDARGDIVLIIQAVEGQNDIRLEGLLQAKNDFAGVKELQEAYQILEALLIRLRELP